MGYNEMNWQGRFFMLRMCKTVVALVLVVVSVLASAAGDIGLVDRLSGEVKVKSGNGSTFAATAFMKVREGDVFTLPAGSEAQIVFFDGRRRELWRGPAAVKATAARGEAISGTPASVSETKGVPNRTALANAGNVQRLGSMIMREVSSRWPDEKAIAQAHADYLKWVASTEPDDILPELSMIGLLRQRDEPGLMAPYLEALQRKQPDRPEVKALIQEYGKPSGKR